MTHTILSIISHIMSNNRQKCIKITRCPSIKGKADFSFQRLRNQLKRFTIAAPKEILNCIFPKSHDSLTDAILFWKRELGRIPVILHHQNKLRFLNLIKWLITCNNPLNEQLFKFHLIPGLL